MKNICIEKPCDDVIIARTEIYDDKDNLIQVVKTTFYGQKIELDATYDERFVYFVNNGEIIGEMVLLDWDDITIRDSAKDSVVMEDGIGIFFGILMEDSKN
jgi:hypothetical protein